MIRARSIGVLVAAALFGALSAQAEEPVPSQGSAKGGENPLALVALDRLAATRQHPLFAPDRRQPDAAPAPAVAHEEPPPPAVGPPQLSLFGIIVEAQGPCAIVRSGAAGKPARLRLGDEVEGWRVTTIEDHALVLSRDDRSITLTMFATQHAVTQVAKVHHFVRVLEVNAAGVLRSHRVAHHH
jgi:general secretion pathway protein N